MTEIKTDLAAANLNPDKSELLSSPVTRQMPTCQEVNTVACQNARRAWSNPEKFGDFR